MPVSYRKKKRRDKGYSIQDGKFKLNQRAAQAFEGAAVEAGKKLSGTPLEKTGLVNKKEEKAQKGWEELSKNVMDSDGNIKMMDKNRAQGFTPTKDGGIDLTKTIDPSKMNKEQVMALQKQIGAKPDGAWGKGSQKALNNYYAFEGIEPPNAKRLESIVKDMGGIIKKKPDNYDTIKGKRPSYGTNELSSGGDVSPELIDVVQNVFPEFNIPGFRVTAGNDAYHQGDRYNKKRVRNSAHKVGKAMDFTTTDPNGFIDQLLEKGYTKHTSGKLTWYKSPDGGHRFLDEYSAATAKTTGKHFDLKVY